MSGQVLYRKWRPPRFSEIVGQDAVTQTLKQAIATGRTSHAYLLCGPRGTGKTSTARVLAKALNCEMRPPGVGDPCGACNACRAIEAGNFVDLIEIDAASNRTLDEMRDLREKVRFSPTTGRYKVYIIDEAHALTSDAFQAFLKTLEEPPPHAVFILATTDPQKLPATIISRCQRYDFHRISPSDVVDRLAEIAQSEGVDVSPEVLRTISRAAGGSLRDATNLLDQLITSFGTNVTLDQVRELLGMGGEERAVALTKHLLTGNTTAALELINKVATEGQDLRPLHRMTVDFLRAALLIKSGVKDSLELSKEASAEVGFAANSVTIEHILRALRVFGQVSLKFDQPSPLPLELATVELSLEPPAPAVAAPAAQAPAPAASAPPQYPQASQQQRPSMPQQQPAQQQQRSPQGAPLQQQQRPPQGAPPQQQRPPQGAPPQGAPPQQQRPAAQPTPPAPVDPNAPIDERLNAQWGGIVNAFKRIPKRRFGIDALFRSSTKRTLAGDELVVLFSHASNAERLQGELEDPRVKLEVERILAQALGEKVTVRVEVDSGRQQMSRNKQGNGGHLVRAAMSLGGQVVEQGTQAPPPTSPSSYEPRPTPESPSGPLPYEEPARSPEAALESDEGKEGANGGPEAPSDYEPTPNAAGMNGHGPAYVDEQAPPAGAPQAEKEPRKQNDDANEEALEDPAEEALDDQTPPAERSEPQSEWRPGSELSYEPIPEKAAEAPSNEPANAEALEDPSEAALDKQTPPAETPASDSEPPAMARNLFNEMQAVPRFSEGEDEEADAPLPPIADRSASRAPEQQPPQQQPPRQQRAPQPASREIIPEDYFPMPDEEYDN